MEIITKPSSKLFYEKYRYRILLKANINSSKISQIPISVVKLKENDIEEFVDSALGDMCEYEHFKVRYYHFHLQYKVAMFVIGMRMYFNNIELAHKLDSKIQSLKTPSSQNNLNSMVKDIAVQDFVVHERSLAYPPNSIPLKNSKYKFRSYFSQQKYSNPSTDEAIKNFLLSQHKNDIRLSPKLSKWAMPLENIFPQFKHHYATLKPKRIENQMFFDHNDMRFVEWISLIDSNAIRKTLDIVVDK